ncbi:hypothetical protein, partial [Streptomyces bohaiensis]|uniref:hypothetical protein n=1 Tax=Streptomyces bohaiensis TaxID=1431344 RepID=UPI0030C77E21
MGQETEGCRREGPGTESVSRRATAGRRRVWLPADRPRDAFPVRGLPVRGPLVRAFPARLLPARTGSP